MIALHGIIASKTAIKIAIAAAVPVAAIGAAYAISAQDFSSIAVGTGAIGLLVVGIVGLLVNSRNNKKTREQTALIAAETRAQLGQIAADTAAALFVQNTTHDDIKVLKKSVDGQLEEAKDNIAKISEAVGVKKGLQQAADTADAKADSTAIRDDALMDKVATAVTDRIGEAADKAALTVPGSEIDARK